MPASNNKLPALLATLALAASALWVGYRATGGFRNLPWTIQQSQTSGDENMRTASKQSIQHANDSTFEQLVLQSNVPVLVDFYADWCGPCQRLAPVLEELAAETPHARIVKVNVDHSPRVSAEYGIESIPSLKLFRQGRVAGEMVGLASKNQLRSMLGGTSL